jgi:hypothetical protein
MRTRINQCFPSGLPITVVNLSRIDYAIHWFMGILTEKEGTPNECNSSGRIYRAFRTLDAVFLEDIRDGVHANVVGFSLREVPTVLAELQQIIAEEFTEQEGNND